MLLLKLRMMPCITRGVTRPFSTTVQRNTEIKNMTVIGAGLMGSGIAQVAAVSGIKVVVHALNQELSENSKSIIHQSLTRMFKKKYPDEEIKQKNHILKVEENLTFTTNLKDSVIFNNDNGLKITTDLVIEAIVEKIQPKQDLFNTLHELLIDHPNTIFTSNTSSLKIKDICSLLTKKRQENFAGLHFFNPVPQMKLVEVIKTDQTSNSTMDKLIQFSKKLDKTPVRCTDTPGFIVNRLLVPYLLEAIRMIERGEASKEDIDTAMKLGAGHPMGPIQLADYVGLDTLKFISDGWRESRVDTGEIHTALVQPVQVLDHLVQNNKLGKKSKHGFFQY